jgi:hypothetical protein
MPRYLLAHQHAADECAVVFAAWRGVDSPLRHERAASTCEFDGHAIWWSVDAASPEAARALLPTFVAERTTVTRIGEVEIP